MKILLLALLTLSLSSFAYLHEYFFAFAEVEYNVETSNYEVSVVTTAHDFEDHMKAKGTDIGHIEKVKKGSALFLKIEEELFSGFSMKIGEQKMKFSLLGYEVNLKDELTFYFKSEKVKEANKLEVTFDLMMETFKNQQNKINFLKNGSKESLTFIKSNPKRTIEFN